MGGARNCPPWCVEHVAGPTGGEHRAIVGDVRLTVAGDVSACRLIYAVRRRPTRTPAEMAKLGADLTVADGLLHREARQPSLEGRDRLDARCGALALV
jgi:hypothetical protein